MEEFESSILAMVSFLTLLKIIKLIIRCKMRDSECCNIDMHTSTHIETIPPENHPV